MKYCSLHTKHLSSWAHLNNVSFRGVEIQPYIVAENGSEKGGGLITTEDHDSSDVLLVVPRDLVLNKFSIEEAARSDKILQAVLDAIGSPFSQTPRMVILLFLLLQLTYSSPELEVENVGVTTPFTDYVKLLPKNISLPTFYGDNERNLLAGTSLEVALDQKLKRLESEFEHVKSRTEKIDWCQRTWWSEDRPLSLTDWKVVDAMYRSRGLELPYITGNSMVPVIDMANHSSNGKHNARFQLDAEGNVQLVVRDDMSIRKGEEVTIMYGDGGACEMIFSYGFLENDSNSAGELFLDLSIPDDDPLKRAKVEYAKEAPGVRLFLDDHQQVKWESPFVWWACVNEEDGLDFRVLQQLDGSTELRATWENSDLEGGDLKRVLMEHSNWEVFWLRAVVLIQGRVERQGLELSLVEDTCNAYIAHGDADPIIRTIGRLRDLEMDFLANSYELLNAEKARLVESDTVRAYLNNQGHDRPGGKEEDFS